MSDSIDTTTPASTTDTAGTAVDAGTAPTAPGASQDATAGTAAPDATDATDASKAPKEPTVEELLEAQRKKNSENKGLRQTNKEMADQLKEFTAWKESQKTEEQRSKEAHDALVAENASLKRTAMMATIKADLGLPAEIVELLQGDDEEELRAHAARLKPLFQKAAVPAAKPAVNPGQAVASGVTDPHAAAAMNLFGSILR